MTADEHDAITRTEAIGHELRNVLERHTTRLDADGHPRFGRYLALHAVTDVLGELLVEAIEADPERGRPWCQATLDHLALVVSRRRGLSEEFRGHHGERFPVAAKFLTRQ